MSQFIICIAGRRVDKGVQAGVSATKKKPFLTRCPSISADFAAEKVGERYGNGFFEDLLIASMLVATMERYADYWTV